VSSLPLPARIPPMSDEEYALLSELIRERFGLEFPSAQRDRVRFRLRNRLEAFSMASFLEYYHLLVLSPEAHVERTFLAEALTNNETYFFREAYQFACFFEKVAASRARGEGPIRLLSAGCSSGEEAYSLAIAWHEHAFRLPGVSCEVFAVDLSAAKIREAERAEYRGSSFRATAPEALSRYFARSGEAWRVKPWIKRHVSFRVANLLELGEAFPPASFDAVFCRNVLIYFAEPVVARVCGLFHKLLVERGTLFLGHSESILGKSSLFSPERAADFIFYRKVSA
jgi:chemotaxis protein methyltransferase CheR